MMKTLELQPIPPVMRDHTFRFSCQLVRKSGRNIESVKELWYEIPEESVLHWKDDDVEPYLIVSMLQAMYEGRDIVARGIASSTLLSNLTEYRDFWSQSLPGLFKKVEFECERIDPETVQPLNRAVSTFSGGLDSLFLAWRYARKQAGYRHYSLSGCAIIHGFDFSHSEDVFFNQVFSETQKALTTLGLPLIPIRTNIFEVTADNWDFLHGAALVSALQFLKSKFDTALIAGCRKYDELVIPWGTSPLTDHLLSSSRFKVLHDGAGYRRTEKAKAILEWPEGTEALRVCFNTRDIHLLNCGHCEKCLRTMACFAVNRDPIPSSLNGSLEDLNTRIKSLKLNNVSQRDEWASVLEEAKRNKIDDPWVKRVPRLFLKLKIRQMRKKIRNYFKK